MTYNELLRYYRDAIRAFCEKKVSFTPNSLNYAIGQTVAALALKILAALEGAEKRTSPLTATSEDLERVFSNFDITRKLSSSATGFVNLWKDVAEGLDGTAVVIEAGTIVNDASSRKFVLTETCVIPGDVSHYPLTILSSLQSRYYALPLASNVSIYTDDTNTMSLEEIRNQFQETINVSLQSEETGTASNAKANSITRTDINGVSCTNPEPLTGGDDFEDDERFRSRALDIIRGSNSKFSYYSVKGFLESYDGVLAANVVEDYNCLSFEPPRSGHIYAIVNTSLIYSAKDTSTPYPVKVPRNLYEKIRNDMEENLYRPLGIGVTVREADIYNVNFKSSGGNFLKVYVTDDAIPLEKKASLQQKLYEYFLSLEIGQDVYKSDIFGLLKEDEEVVDVEDFTFLQIYGTDANGYPAYNEVTSLEASCNQVFRATSSETINLKVVTKG